VFDSVYTKPDNRVCSWQTLRLAPRKSLGDIGTITTSWTPSDEASPKMLAFAKAVLKPAPSYGLMRTDLRLLSLGSTTEPELVDLKKFPTYARQLLFHPSGRFLYVSVTTDACAYAAAPAGRAAGDRGPARRGRRADALRRFLPLAGLSVHPSVPRL
jgi:hypothetical protein